MKYYLCTGKPEWLANTKVNRVIGTAITYSPEGEATYYNRTGKKWSFMMTPPSEFMSLVVDFWYEPTTLEVMEEHLGYKLEEAVPLEPIKDI